MVLWDMTHAYSLINHLLVAMPRMGDERFERSVIYVCEHTKEGAIGLVVNKAMDLAFADVLIHLGHLNKHTQEFALAQPILWGGPCASDRGFVLHRPSGQWKNSFIISDEITLTTSQDIILGISRGTGPEDALIAFGCSRWSPGQLERELAENVWLTVPADDSVLFNCPMEERWAAAATVIGIDFERMAYAVGHA